jgi:uncharacterized protein YuzE
MPRLSYDDQLDALYIALRPAARGSVTTHIVSEAMRIDYGADGLISGIEVLDASAVMGTLARQIAEARGGSGPPSLRRSA